MYGIKQYSYTQTFFRGILYSSVSLTSLSIQLSLYWEIRILWALYHTMVSCSVSHLLRHLAFLYRVKLSRCTESYCVVLNRIVSYHIPSYLIVSCPVVPCCIVSYCIASYNLMSCRVVSYLIYHFL